MSAADSSVNVLGSGSFPVDVSLGTDATSLASVYRQRFVLGDDLLFGNLAAIGTAAPSPGAGALAVRLALGSPELADLKEILFLLLQTQNQQLALFSGEVPTTDRGRLATTSYEPAAAVTNVSSAITTGGTAQLLFSASNVRGFELQNLSSAEALGFSWWTTAPVIGNASTYVLASGAQNQGGYYVTPPHMGIWASIAVWIIGATTGHAYSGSYWQ